MPTVFLDTNILVYAAEAHYPPTPKGAIARQCLRAPGLALSVQVLSEFIVTARNPNKLALDLATERRWLKQFQRLHIAAITAQTVIQALRIHDRFQLSHWDSLVIAAAKDAGCHTLLTEDLSNGQDYDGILVENPFA